MCLKHREKDDEVLGERTVPFQHFSTVQAVYVDHYNTKELNVQASWYQLNATFHYPWR